jgi:hypothetical protein
MIVGLGRKTMFTHCAGQVYFGAAPAEGGE